jgi:hypothetical protein
VTTTPPAPAISESVITHDIALKPAQPLWQFVLVGLGPLTAMLIFALLLELARRLS